MPQLASLDPEMSVPPHNLKALPGAHLIQHGVADLKAGHETIEALLVSIGASRLRSLGIELSSPIASLSTSSICSWRTKRAMPLTPLTTP